MRQNLTQRLLQHVHNEGWLRPGQRLGVAVSGGADSVALLHLLLELREKLGIVLSVIHFNHRLRGKASDSDEKFVATLAEKFGLPIHVAHADVAAKARREKANLEDAGRRARYAFFQKLVAQGTADRVATAHTMDDQAETVLAHILRGTGLAGLGAIHSETPIVVRPLLFARRSELRSYLRAKKQLWREDATNRDTSRLRARIRMKLLPLLEKHFQLGTAAHLATLAELARQDEALLDAVTEYKVAAIAKREPGGMRIGIADLLGEEGQINNPLARRALAKRIVRSVADKIRSRPGEWSAEHTAQVWDLAARGANGKMLQLPGAVEVRRENDTLFFCSASACDKSHTPLGARNFEYSIVISAPDSLLRVPELGCAFRFRVIDWPPRRRDTSLDKGTVLDRGRLIEPLVLRDWRPGDRLRCTGHRRAQKLKHLLNQKRVGRWERAGWPVITSGGVLAWARGFPAAAEFAADQKTRRGVVISEESF
ncbi:MAG TPA: tRNA lysidine(34) synthetase TilS [Terriglobales bacterium]|nr:tRNA lysidine(34) synthetase TilS [Terriglobales bacterium]